MPFCVFRVLHSSAAPEIVVRMAEYSISNKVAALDLAQLVQQSEISSADQLHHRGMTFTTLAYISLKTMMAVLGLTRCPTLAHTSPHDDDVSPLVCAADADHRLSGEVQQHRQGPRRWLGGQNPGHPRPWHFSRCPYARTRRCAVDCTFQVLFHCLALEHPDHLSDHLSDHLCL